MASIRRRFETAGFSPNVIEILLSSWSESTKKRYAGPWKAWAEWCTMRGWCPFSAPVTAVLSFLASLLKEKDLEYRTIAVYRSAISQTHDSIDSVPLGELPIVSKFMKGVFRAKPPKPKYCSSWNVAKVLDFLRNQEPLDKIPLKMLTFKLTALLALTTSARAHELAALDLDFSLVKEEAWEFTIPEHVKNSRPGHPPRKFYLPSFPQDSTICVVRVLRAHTLRTGNIRKARKLLVSYIAPYDSVSSQTVSRWLTQTIHLAGIALDFTGHSTRSASTSAAADAGLSLDLIVEAGDWSSAKVFEKHYHKRPDRTAFVHVVLNS
jgi:integrase